MSSTSSQPSRSSPSPSSSSSTNRHPNSPLPKLTRNPLKPPAQTAFTTLSPLLAPLGSQSIVSSTQTPEPPETPEKCLTFCSQRHNAPPLCRMLCLRRRNPQLSQKEQIARLRPQRRASSTTSDEATTFTSPTISFLSSFSPFESLRRRLEPYSFVFIRGTPNGVVGRYMEEMEHDDGQYDSGTKSRGAGHLHRRKRADTGVKFLDWGDHGSLMYLPLTSIFHPILSIPRTLNRLLSPTQNFLTRYRETFSDGTQFCALDKFRAEVEKGGAVGVLGKVRGHWEKKYAESKELIEKQREVEEKEVKEIVKKDVKGKDVVREGQKEGAPIDKIRAAIQHQVRERKAQLERQREAEREGVKKVGKEVEGKGE